MSVASLLLWSWLAIRAIPSFESLLRRYEEDVGPAPEPGLPRIGNLGRLAAGATAMALTFSAIGYAIPD